MTTCLCGKDHGPELNNLIDALFGKKAEPKSLLNSEVTEDQRMTLDDAIYDGDLEDGKGMGNLRMRKLIEGLVPLVRAVATTRKLGDEVSTILASEPSMEKAKVVLDIEDRIKAMNREVGQAVLTLLDQAEPLVNYYFPEVSTVRT